MGQIFTKGALALLLLASAGTAAAQGVEAGVRAWQSGQYEEAVRNWRPLADRGDQDAQFNLGHAYRLGRGVPQNMTLAEQWSERAARSGHVEAQAMYGLILFQNGRQRAGMPFVLRAAERGDARAQYVYGTALFNGDIVARDWPRAYAFMTLAARSGLPYASSQLTQMEEHIGQADRSRGVQLAEAMAQGATSDPAAPTRVASTNPGPPDRGPGQAGSRAGTLQRPGGTVRTPPRLPTQRPVTQPSPPPRQPVRLASASGRWRVQLGAFSNEANARRAWNNVRGRLPGLQPYFVPAGAMIRLQVGPFASREAAANACAATGQDCFPVGN
ncbi:MAG: SPOR domain-containing protein [Sphingosinicella sp.]